MKSSGDVIGAINALEERFPVERWRAGDVDLWPSYRFRLYGNTTFALLGSPPATPTGRLAQIARRVSQATARVPFAAMRDRAMNASKRMGADVVALSDGVSFTELDGTWYDRIIDPIMDAMATSNMRMFKMTPLANAHVPRARLSRFIQPHIDLIKLRASRRNSMVDLPEFDDFFRAAREIFDDHAPTAEWLRVQASRLEALAIWFERQLARSGARHALVNTYYSLEGSAFVQAARRQKITSVDVQHGVQGCDHVAYGRWNAVPPHGYSTLPDEFWVWGDREVQAISNWATVTSRHRARIIGNPWLQRWFDERDPVVTRYLAEAQAMRSLPTKVHALACLVWGVGSGEIDTLIEAAKAGGAGIEWWWRLHPVETHLSSELVARLEAHGLDGSKVAAATGLPLPALIRAADVVVSHSSTAVQEAAQLGIPSVVTSGYGAELFRQQIGEGIAIHAEGADVIANAVRAQAASGKRTPVRTATTTPQVLVDTVFCR